ncbi:MAG: hypothetical protein WDW36_009586 [Sanguina aurantia]
MSNITIFIKPTATAEKITLEIVTSSSVADLKEAIACKQPIIAAEQRLIYKGQILKDERTVESYGIAHEHVLHMVKGKPVGGAAPRRGGSDMQSMMSSMMGNPMMQSMMSNPEALRGMLQSNPTVRQLMDSHPELAQALNDPALLRQSMQMAANPNLMREHMRTADRQLSNIESMPEGFNALRRMYENVQEPLANAASGGGGAGNPMAALMASLQGGGAAHGTPVSDNGSSAAPASETPNSNPLPNPWAPAAPANPGAAAPLGMGGMGMGLPAGLGGLGGMGGLPAGMDMNSMMTMMQNPVMQQMMSSMMSQPGFMEQVIGSNPAMQSMVNSTPGMRWVGRETAGGWGGEKEEVGGEGNGGAGEGARGTRAGRGCMYVGETPGLPIQVADKPRDCCTPPNRSMLANPEALRTMMDPAHMASMMQMQRNMNTMFPGMTGAPAPAAAAPAAAAPGGMDLGAMMRMMGGGGGMGGGMMGGGMGGMGGMGGGEMDWGGVGAAAMQPPVVADPEVAYASQLQQLADMGFTNRRDAVAALQATGGNVQIAVERLLG